MRLVGPRSRPNPQNKRKISILLNIMFHALMGRFQLELFIFITYLLSVARLGQETEETTRPVENVSLTTKGLQERNQLVSGTTVEK